MSTLGHGGAFRPTSSSSPLLWALVAGAALVVVLAAVAVGPLLVLGAAAVGLVGLVLLGRPRTATALYVVVIVVCENDVEWGVPFLMRAYSPITGDFALTDFLFALAIAATVLAMMRRRVVEVPTPLGLPLAFLGLTYVLGFLNGYLSGQAQSFQLLGTSLSYAPLFVLPVLLVNLLGDGRDLSRLARRAGVLTFLKAVAGLGVVYGGIALTAGPELPPLTFYEPTSNLCLLVFLLTWLTARLSLAVRVPRFVDLAALVVLITLVLSYRRTFWLATLLCVAVVVLIATRPVARRLIVPTLLATAVLGGLVLRSGIGGDVSGPLVTRVESITPSKVSSNDSDRYRLTERRNVLAELSRRPLTGIGVGVPWKTRYPINLQVQFLNYYTHTAVLWQWLKNGLLGALAYVWLMVTGVACGIRVFRRHPDGLIRVLGLGAGVGLVGLAVVELASTVVGPDVRGTVVVGVLLGLLAVAHRGMPPREARITTV